jgi:integrase
MAVFTCLRQSEVFALTRQRIDLEHKTVTVVESAHELRDGRRILGPPKTAAGYRTVVIPDVIVADVARHLRTYVEVGPDSVVFTGAKGAPLRRSHWAPAWREAISSERV